MLVRVILQYFHHVEPTHWNIFRYKTKDESLGDLNWVTRIMISLQRLQRDDMAEVPRGSRSDLIRYVLWYPL